MPGVEVDAAGGRVVYDIAPGDSAVLIQARSNIGPIELATTDVSGTVAVALSRGAIDPSVPADATITLPVESLRSGKPLYDNEIHRRLDAQRYPTITARLLESRMVGSDAVALAGLLTLHGQTRELTGGATIESIDDRSLVLVGEEIIDVRDFSIALPTALMMRIYPDVVVAFRIHATAPS